MILTSKYFKVLIIKNSATCITIAVNCQVSAKLAFEYITSWKVTLQILLLGKKCLTADQTKISIYLINKAYKALISDIITWSTQNDVFTHLPKPEIQ